MCNEIVNMTTTVIYLLYAWHGEHTQHTPPGHMAKSKKSTGKFILNEVKMQAPKAFICKRHTHKHIAATKTKMKIVEIETTVTV